MKLRNGIEKKYCKCGNPLKPGHNYCTRCGWPGAVLNYSHDPGVSLSRDRDTATIIYLENMGMGILEVKLLIPEEYSDGMYFYSFDETIITGEKEAEIFLKPQQKSHVLLFFKENKWKTGEERRVYFTIFSRDLTPGRNNRDTWFPGDECIRIIKPKLDVVVMA